MRPFFILSCTDGLNYFVSPIYFFYPNDFLFSYLPLDFFFSALRSQRQLRLVLRGTISSNEKNRIFLPDLPWQFFYMRASLRSPLPARV